MIFVEYSVNSLGWANLEITVKTNINRGVHGICYSHRLQWRQTDWHPPACLPACLPSHLPATSVISNVASFPTEPRNKTQPVDVFMCLFLSHSTGLVWWHQSALMVSSGSKLCNSQSKMQSTLFLFGWAMCRIANVLNSATHPPRHVFSGGVLNLYCSCLNTSKRQIQAEKGIQRKLTICQYNIFPPHWAPGVVETSPGGNLTNQPSTCPLEPKIVTAGCYEGLHFKSAWKRSRAINEETNVNILIKRMSGLINHVTTFLYLLHHFTWRHWRFVSTIDLLFVHFFLLTSQMLNRTSHLWNTK